MRPLRWPGAPEWGKFRCRGDGADCTSCRVQRCRAARSCLSPCVIGARDSLRKSGARYPCEPSDQGECLLPFYDAAGSSRTYPKRLRRTKDYWRGRLDTFIDRNTPLCCSILPTRGELGYFALRQMKGNIRHDFARHKAGNELGNKTGRVLAPVAKGESAA